MARDLPEHVRRLDRGDHEHPAPAARTLQDIEVEDTTHQIGPRPIAGLLRAARTVLFERSLGGGRDTGRFTGASGGVGCLVERKAAAREQTEHATPDRGEQAGYVLVARWMRGVKREGAIGGLGKDAVEEQAMEVNVQPQAAPEALDHGDAAAASVGDAAATGSAAIEAEHGADVDGEHRAAELVARSGSMRTH